MTPITDPNEIVEFWCSARVRELWWQKNPAFDREVETCLGAVHARAAAGALDSWEHTPVACLALVILLDQVPRNIHRDSALAFACDARARAATAAALARGHDSALPHDRRFLLYMPLEHSEKLPDQERSVALFEALGDEKLLDFARRHRDIIRQFGRFPHRNAVLGRRSTPEETDFLREPGSSF